MPLQDNPLVDCLFGTFLSLGFMAFCMTQWRWFRPHLGPHFWPIFYWSHGIGFLIAVCAYVINVAIDTPAVGRARIGFGCFAGWFPLSLTIGFLLMVRVKGEFKSDHQN